MASKLDRKCRGKTAVLTGNCGQSMIWYFRNFIQRVTMITMIIKINEAVNKDTVRRQDSLITKPLTNIQHAVRLVHRLLAQHTQHKYWLRQADTFCYRPNYAKQEKGMEGEIKKNRNGPISNVRNTELGTEQRQKRNRTSGRHCFSVTFWPLIGLHTECHTALWVVLSHTTSCNPHITLSVVTTHYILQPVHYTIGGPRYHSG